MRQLHIDIFNDSTPQEYALRDVNNLPCSRRDVQQRIYTLSESKMSQIIKAVAPFDETEIRPAWSHTAALICGRHLFPDANHRTAMTVFSWFTNEVWGDIVYLEEPEQVVLGRRSKEMRDNDRLQRPGPPRYYTVEELADPRHAYRRLFAKFEPKLVIL